jgi:hypothetical protein
MTNRWRAFQDCDLNGFIELQKYNLFSVCDRNNW